MSDDQRGPCFGVPLPTHLDFPGGMQKPVPTRQELEKVVASGGGSTIKAFEASLALVAAIDRGGYDVSRCRICQQLVVCIPDGLAMCKQCAEKAGG
jgi:hypothetical protein